MPTSPRRHYLKKIVLELLSNVSCTSQKPGRRPKESKDDRGLPTTPIGMPRILAVGAPEIAEHMSGTFWEMCKAFSEGFVQDRVIIPRCFCQTPPWIRCLKPAIKCPKFLKTVRMPRGIPRISEGCHEQPRTIPRPFPTTARAPSRHPRDVCDLYGDSRKLPGTLPGKSGGLSPQLLWGNGRFPRKSLGGAWPKPGGIFPRLF